MRKPQAQPFACFGLELEMCPPRPRWAGQAQEIINSPTVMAHALRRFLRLYGGIEGIARHRRELIAFFSISFSSLSSILSLSPVGACISWLCGCFQPSGYSADCGFAFTASLLVQNAFEHVYAISPKHLF